MFLNVTPRAASLENCYAMMISVYLIDSLVSFFFLKTEFLPGSRVIFEVFTVIPGEVISGVIFRVPI